MDNNTFFFKLMKLNIKPKCLLVYYFTATFSCPLHINIDCLYFGSCYQLNLTKNNVLYKINISYALSISFWVHVVQ